MMGILGEFYSPENPGRFKLLPSVAEYGARQEAEQPKAEAAGTSMAAVTGEVKADCTATASTPMEAPQPLVREIPEAVPFPMSALGPLREAAEAAQDCTQCPPALAAQSTLAVAALAAQGLRDVETLYGSSPASLFLLTVAQSGERKSSTDKLLMKPVAAYEEFLRDQYREKEQSYKAEFAAWKSTHDEVLKTRQGGKSEDAPKTIEERKMAKDADLRELGPEPTPPMTPQLIASEPTVEGLIKSMAFGQPSQGVFSDEGGAFVGGHGMSEDNRLKTCAQLSDFWGGEPINRTRAGDGCLTLVGRRVSLHLMMQGVAADALLGDGTVMGQGLLARCLVTEPTSTIGTRMYREPQAASIVALSRFESRIKELLTTDLPLKPDTQNELDPPVLPLSPEARELLIAFHDDTEREQKTNRVFGEITGFASKVAENACRLAGVMAVYAGETAVSADLMRNAIRLMGYYLSEALRLTGAATVSAEIKRAEEVRRWLLEKGHVGKHITRRMITRGPRCVRDSGHAKSAIKLLVEHGWLAPSPPGVEVEGKPAKEAWLVRGVS